MKGLVPSPVLDRFIDRITVTDSCWIWGAGGGYGKFMPDGRRSGPRTRIYAHRFAYEQFVGPIATGLELDHLCKTPSCVRPDHLEPVTHMENIRRGFNQTHCGNGHPRNEANTYIRPSSGQRECRACLRESQRRLRERRVPTTVAPKIEKATAI